MDVLVSDTSVIIDLERAQIIERIFALPFRFIVPDIVFEKEMRDYGGERLIAKGLQVRTLTGEQVQEAQRLRALERRISIHDSYALSLAKAEAAILLAGDAAMRRLAAAEGVRCHGVLWVFDQLEDKQAVPPDLLLEALSGKVLDAASRTSLLGRSHFGDLQFLHAMASRNGEPAAETSRRVMMWARFAWGVATGQHALGAKLKDVPVESMREHIGRTEWTVQDLFTLGNHRQCSAVLVPLCGCREWRRPVR